MAKLNPAPKSRKPKTPKAAVTLEAPQTVDIRVHVDGPAETNPKASRSKYQPTMCATIVALGKKGKSKAQCAAHLEISRSTFDRYLEAHEEFRDAWDLADTYAQAFWEDIGLGGVGNKFFNDRAWSLQMRNRFAHSYKENRELELSGVGGSPIEILLTPADSKL